MVDPVGGSKKSSHDVIGALTSQIHSYKIRKSQFWKGLAELGAQPLWWKFEPLYHTSLVIWQNSSRRTSRSGINDFSSNFSCPKKRFLVSLSKKLVEGVDISIFARDCWWCSDFTYQIGCFENILYTINGFLKYYSVLQRL